MDRRCSLLLASVMLMVLTGAVGCKINEKPEQSPSARPYPRVKNAPYRLRGRSFVPLSVDEALFYRERGEASFYDASGGITATGERPKRGAFYAAHRTLPLPCTVKISNPLNGKSCVARVCDRGPFHMTRIIDVSPGIAHELDFVRKGVHEVDVEVLSVGEGVNQRTHANPH